MKNSMLIDQVPARKSSFGWNHFSSLWKACGRVLQPPRVKRFASMIVLQDMLRPLSRFDVLTEHCLLEAVRRRK